MNGKRRKQTESAEQMIVWRVLSGLGRAIGRAFGWKPQIKPGLEGLLPHWTGIVERWHTRDPHQLQVAVMEADKLLDEALRILNVPGATLGEKLKNGRPKFKSEVGYQSAWEGHKLRNRLAHELGGADAYELSRGLSSFHQAFRELGLVNE